MTEKSGATKNEGEIKEHEVAEFLHRHPDFFSRHEYLLDELVRTIPDGVYLNKFAQRNKSLTMNGIAPRLHLNNLRALHAAWYQSEQ